jgi:hypothetical protein
MGKDNKKIELETSAINPFEPRLENEGIEFKVEDGWYKNLDMSKGIDLTNSDIVNAEPLFSPRVEEQEPVDSIYEWWTAPPQCHPPLGHGKPTPGKRDIPDTGARFEGEKLISVNASPEAIQELKSVIRKDDGNFGILKESTIASLPFIEFKPTPLYQINVSNIQTMDDARHIFRVIGIENIRVTESVAQTLPLHLVKHVVTK